MFVSSYRGGGIADYFPRTSNSNWSYKFDNDPMDTLFQNVISQTQSALGNTYNVFMYNGGSGVDTLGYYRKNQMITINTWMSGFFWP